MRSYFGRVVSIAFVAAALSATAFAGFKTGQQVVIADGDRFANGDIGYARNTGDSIQRIGCEVNGDVGTCYARNRDGLSRSCYTSSAKWVNTMRALNGDSWLYFKWDAAGKCISIIVDNGSTSAPK